MLFSKFKRGAGIWGLKQNLNEYDRVILCGPVWMGMLIAPLRGFINRYKNSINDLYFATCCGTSYAEKDGKYGHANAFAKIKELYGNKSLHCEAFPIPLVLPEDKIDDSELIMSTRLSDQNFTGEILKRFNDFINMVTR